MTGSSNEGPSGPNSRGCSSGSGPGAANSAPAASRSAVETSSRDARRRRWIEDNCDAFADYDRFVGTHGVFAKGKKLF